MFEEQCDACFKRLEDGKPDADPFLIKIMSNENISRAEAHTAVADLFLAGVDTVKYPKK